MGQSKKPKIPRLLPDVDITQLPLGPVEGFVVSRIDGHTSVDDIADMTGLPGDQVFGVVDQLIEADAAEWVEPIHPRARHSSFPRGTPVSLQGGTPSKGTLRTKPAPPGASRSLYDPQELEEPDVDLDVERRRQILDTFYRLEETSFYELLGVAEDAEKKDIRAAYFALSKKFHPDTLYGKRLGSYRKKMEAVFKALTEAYEVLGKKRTRSEYDAYLKLRRRTRSAEISLDEAAREAERIEQVTAGAAERMVVGPEEAAEPAEPAEEPPVEPEPAPEPEPSEPAPEPEPSEPAPRREPSEAAKQRSKKLLARKLAAATGRRLPGKPPPRSAQPPPPSSKPPAEAGDREALLRGLASSLKRVASHTGGIDRTQKLADEARRAEKEGRLVEAANSMRMALALSPDRKDLADEYDRLRRQLAESLSETYEQQAQYEEKAGRWAEAALSWSKVCEGRPNDAHAHRRTAVALVEASGDLARAKTFAQKAVDLLPEDPRARRALGRVFHAAGMTLNARRELEKAATLDPSDEIVKNLLRELEKGGKK